MKSSRGCSGITKHACTQPWATSAPSSLNSSGIEQRSQSQVTRRRKQKQAMEKQESKVRFPTFPQPLRLRTITTYEIRILRARSVGLSELEATYDDVADIQERSISNRMIHLSIRLDHFDRFPKGEIENLA